LDVNERNSKTRVFWTQRYIRHKRYRIVNKY